MINIYKLAKLPYSQGIRKTAKIFEDAERGFIQKNSISEKEIIYLADILKYWMPLLPENTGKALKKVFDNLEDAAIRIKPDNIRRSLNRVHHVLRREAGQFPADWDFYDENNGKLDAEQRTVFPGMEIYIEDIRSPFNVGAIFRCAESFGAERIYLSPFCADPDHPRSQRTAMGCVSVMPWTRLACDPFDCDNTDKKPEAETENFPPEAPVFALETGGMKLEEFQFPERGIMIIGSEELGVSPNALARADASLGRVSIPILGAKGSLNVSVAFGIAMHAWAAVLQKRN